MFSKRSLEGYLLIDHRAGDGIDSGVAKSVPGAIPVRSGGLFESATITCSHCQRQVVLNPDRTRERGYCPKCDHYVCDGCEAVRVASGGECRTFKQIMDDVQNAALKQEKIQWPSA